MSNEIERVEGEVIPTPKSPEQAGRELGEALAKFNQAWVGVITGVKQGLGNPPIVVENELRVENYKLLLDYLDPYIKEKYGISEFVCDLFRAAQNGGKTEFDRALAALRVELDEDN
jgi:hypothetical protein